MESLMRCSPIEYSGNSGPHVEGNDDGNNTMYEEKPNHSTPKKSGRSTVKNLSSPVFHQDPNGSSIPLKNLTGMLNECENMHQSLQISQTSHAETPPTSQHSFSLGKQKCITVTGNRDSLNMDRYGNLCDAQEKKHDRSFASKNSWTFAPSTRLKRSSTFSSRGASSRDSSLISSPQTLDSSRQSLFSDFESNTIQKQRKELQLLILELKERDRELNEMVASHQSQLAAWNEDRHRVLQLEQKSASLEYEVRVKNEQLRGLVKKIRILESKQYSQGAALENTQQQLARVAEAHSHDTMKLKDMQEKNMDSNKSLKELSGKLGQLEAKEQELVTLLSLKDKDVNNAKNQIVELTSQMKKLEMQFQEAQRCEVDVRRQATEVTLKHIDCQKDIEQLRSDLNKSLQEEENFQEERGKLQQEIHTLKAELALAADRDRCNEELIESQRLKQERTDAEITSLRQLYERQQRDLSLLHLNLESTNEMLVKQHSFSLEDSVWDGSVVYAMSNTSVPEASFHSLSYADATKATLLACGAGSSRTDGSDKSGPASLAGNNALLTPVMAISGQKNETLSNINPRNLEKNWSQMLSKTVPLPANSPGQVSGTSGIPEHSNHATSTECDSCSHEQEEDAYENQEEEGNGECTQEKQGDNYCTQGGDDEYCSQEVEENAYCTQEGEENTYCNQEGGKDTYCKQGEEQCLGDFQREKAHPSPSIPELVGFARGDSPTSRLERLLTESQQMVESMEKSMNSSRNSDQCHGSPSGMSENTSIVTMRAFPVNTTDAQNIENLKKL